MESSYQHLTQTNLRVPKMLTIGLGGAGCKSTDVLYREDEVSPDVLNMHTNAESLDSSKAQLRLQLGTSLTHGLSAGGDLQIGSLCIQQDEEAIRDLVEAYDMVILVVGLGGGTGSGGAPPLVKLLRKLDILTFVFAILPFDFEGDNRKRQAEATLADLKGHANAVVCFPNQRLFELGHKNISLNQAFHLADDYLSKAICSMYELCSSPGLLGLDFSDVQSLAENSHGTCSVAVSVNEGADAGSQCVEELLSSPMLEHGSLLAKSDAVLIGIIGNENLSLSKIKRIFNEIITVAKPEAKIYTGVSIDKDKDGVSLLLFTSEDWFGPKELIYESEKPELDENGERIPAGIQDDLIQSDLGLEKNKNMKYASRSSTVINGEDLDIPTFIRKNIKLSN